MRRVHACVRACVRTRACERTRARVRSRGAWKPAAGLAARRGSTATRRRTAPTAASRARTAAYATHAAAGGRRRAPARTGDVGRARGRARRRVRVARCALRVALCGGRGPTHREPRDYGRRVIAIEQDALAWNVGAQPAALGCKWGNIRMHATCKGKVPTMKDLRLTGRAGARGTQAEGRTHKRTLWHQTCPCEHALAFGIRH